MDVMFEHTPDDLLARNGGSHCSRTSRRIQPHLGEWLERRLDQVRVTHPFRLIQRREGPGKRGRGAAGGGLLGSSPGLFPSRPPLLPPGGGGNAPPPHTPTPTIEGGHVCAPP